MEALYFPYLSLPAATWVNPALLFFDRLGVIAPEGSHSGLFDRRTEELVELGLAQPITPHGIWDDRENDAFIGYMLGRASAERSYGRVERVHVGKLSYTPLAATLEEAGLLARVDGAWLEGPAWVVGRVMAYLAVQTALHSRRPLPLLTDERAAARAVVGSEEARTMSRRVRAVSRLLPVPADIPPVEIERFRRRHRHELTAFREYIAHLTDPYPTAREVEASFEEQLQEAERVKAHLIGEMNDFQWRKFGPDISILALTVGASAIEQSPWSAGVGLLGLVIAGARGAAEFRNRLAAVKSPLVYAARVTGRWQPSLSHFAS